MTPDDRLASFWAHECGARGPALSHVHGRCTNPPQVIFHHQCPCKDCGLTPERWVNMVEPTVRQIPAPPTDDDAPLQLPQTGEPGAQIKEPGLAKGEYQMFVPFAIQGAEPLPGHAPQGRYQPGDPNGPGRGLLSPAWVEWALTATWLS